MRPPGCKTPRPVLFAPPAAPRPHHRHGCGSLRRRRGPPPPHLQRHERVLQVATPRVFAHRRCASLLDDHRLLVEPACGAALALLYSERHRAALASFDPLVVVVCGGSGVDWEIMAQWRAAFLPAAAP